MIPALDWPRFKAILFDVDGTLYDQPQLRKIMTVELAVYCLFHPARWREARILATFRRQREENFERVESNLDEAQYRWTAERLGVDSSEVRQIGEEWLLRRPLRHMLKCRPPGLAELFERARQKRVKIGVFSDYPATEKLRALELSADAVACATDAAVNRFKPHPAGLQLLCQRLGVSPCDALHIGDRDDRDAVCAQRCGCVSLILPAHRAKVVGRAESYDLILP